MIDAAKQRLEWIKGEYGDEDIDFRTFNPIVAELEQVKRDFAGLAVENLELRNKMDQADKLAEALRRSIYVGEHLMQMIPQQTWRDEGGDDGQGHYEGDYRAARIMEDFREWREALTEWENKTKGENDE